MSAPLICLCVLCRVQAILRKDLSLFGHFVNTLDKFDIAILNELQVVARDLDSFSLFARDELLNLPNVKDMHTSFSLGEVKASGALPLTHLARPRL